MLRFLSGSLLWLEMSVMRAEFAGCQHIKKKITEKIYRNLGNCWAECLSSVGSNIDLCCFNCFVPANVFVVFLLLSCHFLMVFIIMCFSERDWHPQAVETHRATFEKSHADSLPSRGVQVWTFSIILHTKLILYSFFSDWWLMVCLSLIVHVCSFSSAQSSVGTNAANGREGGWSLARYRHTLSSTHDDYRADVKLWNHSYGTVTLATHAQIVSLSPTPHAWKQNISAWHNMRMLTCCIYSPLWKVYQLTLMLNCLITPSSCWLLPIWHLTTLHAQINASF